MKPDLFKNLLPEIITEILLRLPVIRPRPSCFGVFRSVESFGIGRRAQSPSPSPSRSTHPLLSWICGICLQKKYLLMDLAQAKSVADTRRILATP
ncbi:uncharacterized protein LOC131002371 isoform X4 [Salvia miltiorrhiza]|uniref:uncharacterized protein LOC131002371 isoform X4 n=1 Tax=Salvia miltiorrhiza TaxID=226208 RepID=UPI0025ACF5F9|nr:uncharacterized protein LOC131002371 isoform X4 [Salvia miltiorrhiza]